MNVTGEREGRCRRYGRGHGSKCPALQRVLSSLYRGCTFKDRNSTTHAIYSIREKYSTELRKKDGDRSLSSADEITLAYRSRTGGMYGIFNVAYS